MLLFSHDIFVSVELSVLHVTFTLERMKGADFSTVHALVFFLNILASGWSNLLVFQPKTFPIPRGIIPQNFKSLGFAVSEELGNIQTDKLTHSLTDWSFDREILYLEIQGNVFTQPSTLNGRICSPTFHSTFPILVITKLIGHKKLRLHEFSVLYLKISW